MPQLFEELDDRLCDRHAPDAHLASVIVHHRPTILYAVERRRRDSEMAHRVR